LGKINKQEEKNPEKNKTKSKRQCKDPVLLFTASSKTNGRKEEKLSANLAILTKEIRYPQPVHGMPPSKKHRDLGGRIPSKLGAWRYKVGEEVSAGLLFRYVPGMQKKKGQKDTGYASKKAEKWKSPIHFGTQARKTEDQKGKKKTKATINMNKRTRPGLPAGVGCGVGESRRPSSGLIDGPEKKRARRRVPKMEGGCGGKGRPIHQLGFFGKKNRTIVEQ